MRNILVAILTLALGITAHAGSSDDRPDCSDLVVIGKILKQEPMPIPDIPDVVVMRWTWHLDIEVTDVLLGPTPSKWMRVRALMHTYYRTDSDYVLLFFNWGKFGYELDGSRFGWGLMKDKGGAIVMPMPEPDPDSVAPEGWMTADYLDRLKPVEFGPNGVAWMKRETDEGHYENAAEWEKALSDSKNQEWLKRNNGWIVPRRGLPLETIKNMVRQTTRRCPR